MLVTLHCPMPQHLRCLFQILPAAKDECTSASKLEEIVTTLLQHRCPIQAFSKHWTMPFTCYQHAPWKCLEQSLFQELPHALLHFCAGTHQEGRDPPHVGCNATAGGECEDSDQCSCRLGSSGQDSRCSVGRRPVVAEQP